MDLSIVESEKSGNIKKSEKSEKSEENRLSEIDDNGHEKFNTPPGSTIQIQRGWLPKEYADYILNRIQEEIPFAFYRRHSWNRDYDVPRGMIMFGDSEIANVSDRGINTSGGYSYSENDVKYPLFDWDISLEKLIIPLSNYPDLVSPRYQRIYKPRDPKSYKGPSVGSLIKQLMIYFNETMNTNYDSALLNEYETGKEYIASHADREALGSNNSVLGISLGGTRDFHFNPSEKAPPLAKKIKTKINHGDIMLMSGLVQEYYTHSLPKRAKAEYRVSITFRSILNRKKI